MSDKVLRCGNIANWRGCYWLSYFRCGKSSSSNQPRSSLIFMVKKTCKKWCGRTPQFKKQAIKTYYNLAAHQIHLDNQPHHCTPKRAVCSQYTYPWCTWTDLRGIGLLLKKKRKTSWCIHNYFEFAGPLTAIQFIGAAPIQFGRIVTVALPVAHLIVFDTFAVSALEFVDVAEFLRAVLLVGVVPAVVFAIAEPVLMYAPRRVGTSHQVVTGTRSHVL